MTHQILCPCVLKGMDQVQNAKSKWTDNVLLNETSIDDISILLLTPPTISSHIMMS